MNWDAIGAVGEVIGAIAVVLTLIYLANEVRLSRLATEAASVDTLASGWNTLNAQLISDPELITLYARGFADPANLGDVDQARLLVMAQSYLNHFQAIHKRHSTGLISGGEFEVHAAAICHVFNSPGGHWVLDRCAITETLRTVIARYQEEPQREGLVGIRNKPELLGPQE